VRNDVHPVAHLPLVDNLAAVAFILIAVIVLNLGGLF
jgi:hypothetical protein